MIYKVLLNSVQGKRVKDFFMIRYLDPGGNPIYPSDPIIIKFDDVNILLSNKNESLFISDDDWRDPFSITYILGNPVYPKDIIEMRSEIGGSYIIRVGEDHPFKALVGAEVNSFHVIKDSAYREVGVILHIGNSDLFFVVSGEECLINPPTLPKGMRVSEED